MYCIYLTAYVQHILAVFHQNMFCNVTFIKTIKIYNTQNCLNVCIIIYYYPSVFAHCNNAFCIARETEVIWKLADDTLTFAWTVLELLDYSYNKINFLCTLLWCHSLHYIFHQHYANNMTWHKEFSVNNSVCRSEDA
jgi:hypothetical protein